MKKQPARTKAPTKSKAKTTTASKTTRAKAVAKKQPAKRKGLIHHTKRVYHLTPKFVHGALIGAFMGMLLVTWVGSTGNAKANQVGDKCWIHVTNPERGRPMTDPVDGLKKFHKDGDRAYVKVTLHGKGCQGTQDVVLVAWKAPAADFKPYKDQILTYYNNRTLKIDETITMSIRIPQCYFQIDLVRGTNPRGIDGGGAYQEGRMIHSIKGGTKSCDPPRQTVNQQVCIIATGKIVTIPAGVYDAAKYAPINDPKCQPKPGIQKVCELTTGQVIEIPVGAYDTTKYGPITAPECANAPVVITPAGTSTLTKTGPPAILTIMAFAVAGGYAFHHAHRHIKKRRARA